MSSFLDITRIIPTGSTATGYVTLQNQAAQLIALEAKVTALAATVAKLSTGGSTTTSSGGPTAADKNTYPLQAPVGSGANGATVALGTGPDQISVTISNDSNSNVFAVLAKWGTNIVALTGPLTVTSNTGQVGGQIFTVSGAYSELPDEIQIVGAGTGLTATFINALSYNAIPYYTDSNADNSRVTSPPADWTTGTFNSLQTQVLTWIPESVVPVVVLPPPPPPLSVISGATINGTAAAGTLTALIAATPAGATLVLPAGTFVGTSSVPNAMTISGAGMGKTVIDCTNLEPTADKGVLVPMAPGVTISDLTIKGAAISQALGLNAAGVRDSAAGIGCTLQNVEIYGCQDGILTFPSNWKLTGCSIHDNGAGGAGGGDTHEMYFSGDTTNTVSLTNTNATCGTMSTHALKSRAGTTTVSGGTFTGSGDPVGDIGGSVVDFPDGGVVSITGATVVTTAGADNHIALSYGTESSLNAAIGETVTLTNFALEDNTGTGAIIESGIATATLVLSGATYKGTTPPTLVGWAQVTGAFVKAA